jgi:DNA-binding MarR family transcriptional regulator
MHRGRTQRPASAPGRGDATRGRMPPEPLRTRSSSGAEPRVSASERLRFDAEKRVSLGQLLIRCARLLDERAVERVNRRAGRELVRPAHTKLLPHIDFDGVRLTELARRLGVTKQAVGQMVGDLETLGVVELLPDPSDGRAKLVRYTPAGLEAMRSGLRVLAELEAELTAAVGAGRLQVVHEALLSIERALSK